MEEKCDKCRFGSGITAHKCGFLDKVGHTKLHVYREEIGGDLRKAYGPGCVAYEPKTAAIKKKPSRAAIGAKKSVSTRLSAVAARREQMRAMYNEGMNDAQIAREMGVNKKTVQNWRNRDCLPPNDNRGRNKKKCGYTDM